MNHAKLITKIRDMLNEYNKDVQGTHKKHTTKFIFELDISNDHTDTDYITYLHAECGSMIVQSKARHLSGYGCPLCEERAVLEYEKSEYTSKKYPLRRVVW